MEIQKEIEFWTHILRDHAEFTVNSLASNEVVELQRTIHFLELFSSYYDKVTSSEPLTPATILELITENKIAVTQFVQFQKLLLSKLMTCSVKLGFTPTFLDHMINEAMEYYRVLNLADKELKINKVLENLRLHKVWLSDAYGHSNFIASQLDIVEAEYINVALDYKKKFQALFIKAFELYLQFERTSLKDGEIDQFNLNVKKEISDFTIFLEEIKLLRKDCKIYSTGTFTDLVPDHMIREEKYYIDQIFSLE